MPSIKLPVQDAEATVIEPPRRQKDKERLVKCIVFVENVPGLVEIVWNRKELKPFPDLLNKLKRDDNFKVSGDFILNAFISDGGIRYNKSIRATSVSPIEDEWDFDDGCTLPVLPSYDEDMVRLNIAIKYQEKKMEYDKCMKMLEKLSLSSEEEDEVELIDGWRLTENESKAKKSARRKSKTKAE
ncbi:hypothetical protein BGX34_009630 [Mortierella sp. NVP85]|nr:hypothetical protein BGX34_009630 [Mortierella sp. NVP85]